MKKILVVLTCILTVALLASCSMREADLVNGWIVLDRKEAAE